MAATDSDLAAKVIERLLTDPAFRAEFRRDPASACRDAGLHDLADEMSIGAGKAMMTLDQRESKSSLAGVMMAAAMEGVGIYQFGEHVLPHIDEVPKAVGDVLSRVSLPAIDLKGALLGGPDVPAVAAPEPDGTEDAAAGAAAAGGGGGAARPAAEPPPPEAKPSEEPAATANGKGAEKTAAVPPEQAAADKAAAKIAAAESPEAKRADEIKDAVEQIKEEAKDLPSANDLPDSGVAPKPVAEVGPGAGQPAQPAAPPVDQPSGRGVAVDQAGVSAGGPRPDPDQYGMAGGGGPVSPQAKAVLENSNITLDANGKADFAKGRMDPRVASILLKLSEKHKIVVSSTTSDHPQSTSGGSVSNHWFGRGLDIATVDGERVDAGSPAGRELAAELAELDASIRPGEVGTPWAISAAGFFTDAGHQDHIHLAFDDPIAADWKPPADLKALDGAAAAPAAAAAPGQPVAAAAAVSGQPAAAVAEPKPKAGDSISFRAVTAEDAAQAKPKKSDSMAFFALQPPAGPASAIAPPESVPAAVADAAAAKQSGASELGASALEVAKGELAKGVREVGGANVGADVNKYLAAAGVPPGNPWCASFVTWALEQSGRKMEGGGWAAVQTWVRNAEAGNNNLEVVSAEDARPGDLVAYDWGGQDDFGSDGHIGFLASNVQDGKFTALEGNWKDAVLSVPRTMGDAGTNMKFIRINGDAPAGAPAPQPASIPAATSTPATTPPTTTPPAAAPGDPAAAPGDPAAAAATPAAAGAAPAGTAPPEVTAATADPAKAQAAAERAGAGDKKKSGTMEFLAVEAKESAAKAKNTTVQFMKAIDPKQANGPVAAAASVTPPEPGAAAAGGPSAPTAAEDAAANQAVGAPVPEGELALQNIGAIGTYPGDSASQAQLAQWLASEAKKAGLPPELPVMASLVESGVKNLKGGDADSAGFFQMRVGIWDNGPYKGFRMNPQLQAKWFIDNALQVKKARLAAGKSVTDPGSYGEWIADIERPAAQYRYKYQLRLTEARKLIGG